MNLLHGDGGTIEMVYLEQGFLNPSLQAPKSLLELEKLVDGIMEQLHFDRMNGVDNADPTLIDPRFWTERLADGSCKTTLKFENTSDLPGIYCIARFRRGNTHACCVWLQHDWSMPIEETALNSIKKIPWDVMAEPFDTDDDTVP